MAKPARKTRLDRDDVLRAALDVADRDGFSELTLVTLAAELNRHASSLYNHVDGIEGLRRDITIRSLEELGARIWRAALGKSGAQGLRAIADAYRGFAAERPGQFEAATTWRRRTDPGDEAVLLVAKPSGEAIYAVMASFGLTGDQVTHAVRSFSSAIVGFIHSAGSSFSPPPPLDATYDRLVDLFVTALASGQWPSASRTRTAKRTALVVPAYRS